MHLDAGNEINWYVNGVLVATQSNSTYIPTGSTSGYRFVHSIENGATGGTQAYSIYMKMAIWQER